MPSITALSTLLFASSQICIGAHAKPATPRAFRSRSPGVSGRQAANNKTWTLADTYEGQSFLDQWDFFTGKDPTNGLVNYQSQADAVAKKLAVVDGKVLTLAVDDFTPLQPKEHRDSVRISSKKTYNSGLFIADFAAMPASCGVWPAWWSVGPNWPQGGEIDVLEGVHVTGTNKVTLHTDAGQTGKTAKADCVSGVVNPDGSVQNDGCGVADADPTSYGKGMNDAGGGVFVHEWLPETGVRMWHFAPGEVPDDIARGEPNPALWSTPVAVFPAGPNCNFAQHFKEHVLTIDTTWVQAAKTATAASGCPKTCEEIIADPTNFSAAKWKINKIQVYN
ncbi:glycoside hydrolase family 16 protein [Mycena rebaudengoi]|nr:glycoside hydrolase family 16 protein [Mycena rebaudengoi]